jgi:hypothetical protein
MYSRSTDGADGCHDDKSRNGKRNLLGDQAIAALTKILSPSSSVEISPNGIISISTKPVIKLPAPEPTMFAM